MNRRYKVDPIVKAIVIIAVIALIRTLLNMNTEIGWSSKDSENHYSDNVFSLISSSENEVFDKEIKDLFDNKELVKEW